MRKREIEAKVKKSFTDKAPNVLEAVLSDCRKTERTGVIMTMEKRNPHKGMKKWIALAAAVALVLAGGAAAGVYRTNFAPAALVSLDVNPGIEIEVNSREKVLSVQPLNKDAQVVVGNMDFKGSDLDVTVNALIGSMLRNGYLTDIANSILVSVDNKDAAKGKELQTRLMAMIDEMLKTGSFTGSVLGQTVTADAELKALQETHGITEGKAELIRQITEKNSAYAVGDLANLSINELNLLVQRKDTALEQITAVGTASDKAYIGKDKAKAIALKHAGVTEQEITGYEWEMDFDDGVMIYEVEFDLKGRDYNYDIDAITGKIVEYEPYRDGNSQSNSSTVQGGSQETVSSGGDAVGSLIGKAKAKEIALNRAGVSAGSIQDYSIELDGDDGVISYEIEFDADGCEYKYDIHAKTGDVLVEKKERLDRDDINENLVSSGGPSEEGVSVSKEKAKSIALAHAGVAADAVRDYRIEVDRDDGVVHYEIEFNAGKMEYSYEVNAKTGSIVKADKEFDD